MEDIPDDDEQDDPSKSPTDPSQGKLSVIDLIHYVVSEPDLNQKIREIDPSQYVVRQIPYNVICKSGSSQCN